jgi:predicted RNA-binding Zn ribbon-like protein
VSRADSDQIPNGLDLVIDYVNTLDIEAGTDSLASAGELAGWLSERGLLAAAKPVSREQHAEAIRLREALRALMLANNDGGGAPAEAWSQLERTARDGELAVHFAPDAVSLASNADGLAGALSRLLVPVAAGLADGSFSRVKACRASDCEWAFYDRSRNRSGVWCEMAVCGNRTKVRAYRTRGASRR